MTPDDRDRSVSPDDDASDEAGDDPASDGSSADESDDARGVEVPMRVYKAVTVFTTLFAIITVVGGFVLLDSATNRATASLSEIRPVAALLAIGLILVGAAAYAFSTRFQAAGMGKSKDDTDEHTDNG
ncbi:DUF7315 family membrane protein [Halorientalis halophila]|uniref:DUF7315 family membrane protein n=1 Tax=Halorientalis halophila TaxID=3108499 RepID=UPI00300AB28A